MAVVLCLGSCGGSPRRQGFKNTLRELLYIYIYLYDVVCVCVTNVFITRVTGAQLPMPMLNRNWPSVGTAGSDPCCFFAGETVGQRIVAATQAGSEHPHSNCIQCM